MFLFQRQVQDKVMKINLDQFDDALREMIGKYWPTQFSAESKVIATATSTRLMDMIAKSGLKPEGKTNPFDARTYSLKESTLDGFVDKVLSEGVKTPEGGIRHLIEKEGERGTFKSMVSMALDKLNNLKEGIGQVGSGAGGNAFR